MLTHMMSMVCGRTVVLTLMDVPTLVRLLANLPRSCSALCNDESFWLIAEMREMILNPVLSQTAANVLVGSCQILL